MNHKRKIIYLAGFMFSISVALASYINSSFISSFVGEKLVSIIYTIGSTCSILALVIAPSILRKIGGHKFLLLIILLNAISFLTLALAKNVWYAIFAFIFNFALNTLIIFSLDEILEIFSKDSTTGKTRGIYLALSGSAWIIAQLSFGLSLGNFSLQTIYGISFIMMISLFFTSMFGLKNVSDPKYKKTSPLKHIKEFLKNKNLFLVYRINFILQLFYSWMVIYTPIYLSAHLGFSWKEIGFIFAFMLLPFSILPFFIGKYADKAGERKMLMFGFLTTSLATLSIFFVGKNELWIWALLLFLTRVGAATIETMADTYFFKHIKPENDTFIGIYRSSPPIAYIVGPLLAFIAFLIIPSFNFIYLILGTLMLSGIYLSSTIKKSDI